jgi:DNA segregation ATPase FtsK/SpoIIIE-like protein
LAVPLAPRLWLWFEEPKLKFVHFDLSCRLNLPSAIFLTHFLTMNPSYNDNQSTQQLQHQQQQQQRLQEQQIQTHQQLHQKNLQMVQNYGHLSRIQSEKQEQVRLPSWFLLIRFSSILS